MQDSMRPLRRSLLKGLASTPLPPFAGQADVAWPNSPNVGNDSLPRTSGPLPTLRLPRVQCCYMDWHRLNKVRAHRVLVMIRPEGNGLAEPLAVETQWRAGRRKEHAARVGRVAAGKLL